MFLKWLGVLVILLLGFFLLPVYVHRGLRRKKQLEYVLDEEIIADLQDVGVELVRLDKELRDEKAKIEAVWTDYCFEYSAAANNLTDIQQGLIEELYWVRFLRFCRTGL